MTKKSVDPVKAYLSRIGQKGGSVKSEAKTLAARANAQKRWPKQEPEKVEA